MQLIARRAFLATGVALGLVRPVLAQPSSWPPSNRLVFEVWRQKKNIGRHTVEFVGDDRNFTVTITADMLIKLGPVPVFRYRHKAVETWRAGRFAELRSETTSNGKREKVDAVRAGGAVAITTLIKTLTAPQDAMPLTHWNPEALLQPLFNPQTGAIVRKAVARRADQTVAAADGRFIPADAYTLTGDAQIVDWYDAQGVWAGLRGRVEDGSYIDYRRVA